MYTKSKPEIHLLIWISGFIFFLISFHLPFPFSHFSVSYAIFCQPKIKFYFEVKVPMNGKAEFAKANELADVKIDQAVKDMNL